MRELIEGLSRLTDATKIVDSAVYDWSVDYWSNFVDNAAKSAYEACIDVLTVVVEVPDAYRGVGTPTAV